MRRLRGEDSQFIFQETRVQHQHTIKIVVIDPGEAVEPPTFDVFRSAIETRIPHFEPFRWRLVKVPFRLGHPWWVEDPELDIDYHVRRATVPAPGGRREFSEVVSMIASTGLERDRPLWQVWRVDGLEGGCIAFVMKMHHSLADGLASAELMLAVLSTTPERTSPPASTADLPHDPMPSRRWLLHQAFGHIGHLIVRFPLLVLATLRWAAAAMRQIARKERPLAAAFSVEAQAWNRPLTPQRWFDYRTLALDDIKEIKNRHGVSINDVFLCLVAGSLRRYLQAGSGLPSSELTATIPVATRAAEEAGSWGNQMTTWMVGLGTDIEDPVDRLREIAARTKSARRAREERGADLQGRWMEYWPLWTMLVNWLPKSMEGRGKASFSVICSNVPGPRQPLYANGNPVTEVISMGPLVKDLGLNFTAWSYCDSFTIGVVACREHVPDVWALNDLIEDELKELLATTGPHSSAG